MKDKLRKRKLEQLHEVTRFVEKDGEFGPNRYVVRWDKIPRGTAGRRFAVVEASTGRLLAYKAPSTGLFCDMPLYAFQDYIDRHISRLYKRRVA